MAMNVLVVGGGGFIGAPTARALLADGHAVRILDSFTPPTHRGETPARLPGGAEITRGDVRDKTAWLTALDQVDVVFHFAAYQDYLTDFSTFFSVNAVGTALLYEVAVAQGLPLKKIIVASSQAVYGEGRYECRQPTCPAAARVTWPDIRPRQQLDQGDWEHRCASCGHPLVPLPNDESGVNPQNQYALSKYSQEQIAITLGRRYGLPTTVLRYSITQGAGQSFYNAYSGAARIFCMSHLLGRGCPVFEDGLQLRDYVSINDVVAANMLVMSAPAVDGEIFNVGGGQAYTVLELAEMTARCFENPRPPVLRGEYRFGDTRHAISDISKLRSLGWNPSRTPAESLQEYAGWLREQDAAGSWLEEARQRMSAGGVIRRAHE